MENQQTAEGYSKNGVLQVPTLKPTAEELNNTAFYLRKSIWDIGSKAHWRATLYLVHSPWLEGPSSAVRRVIVD